MTKEEFIAGAREAFSATVQPATVKQIAHIAETPETSGVVLIENTEQFAQLKAASNAIAMRWSGENCVDSPWCMLIENNSARHGHRLWRHATNLDWLPKNWTSHYDGFYVLPDSSFVFGVDELI